MAPAARRHLVVMVKQPVAGRVKTRLAREIGVARATWLYRHLVWGALDRLGRDTRFRLVLAVAPDTALTARVWPAGIPRTAQGRGNLGARMQRLLALALPGDVIVVGSDIPALSGPGIAGAFRTLAGVDACFGPACDGGFWLVGLRRRPRILSPFEGVAWSRPDTLSRTLENLEGASLGSAPTLGDVDDGADYRRSRHLAGRRILPRAPKLAQAEVVAQ